MLSEVKLAMRIKTDAYDSEINLLIDAAKQDLAIAGIAEMENPNALYKRAIFTYCIMNFGDPENYLSLKKSYDEQKGQMAIALKYREDKADA